mgnify:CR=1 FL=1
MWIYIIVCLGIVTIILSFLHVYVSVNSIVTRKIFHIVICLVSLYNTLLYKENEIIFIIPCIFLFSVFIIKRCDLMPFMNRGKEEYGDLWLAIIIFISSVLVYLNIINEDTIYIYFLILGFGDGVSGLTPVIFRNKTTIYNGKSLQGSVLFFVFSMSAIIIFNDILFDIMLWKVLFLCLSSTLLEFVSNKVSDNVLIYINVIVLSYII